MILLDQVPLVHRNDQALLLLFDIPRDMQVLSGETILGVDDEDHDIGTFDGAHRAHNADPLNPLLHPSSPADSGGVDQGDRFIIPEELCIQAVASGTRDAKVGGKLQVFGSLPAIHGRRSGMLGAGRTLFEQSFDPVQDLMGEARLALKRQCLHPVRRDKTRGVGLHVESGVMT